jgi:hypothetical protein
MKGILLDNEGNLLVRNGELVIGDSRYQDAAILLGAWTGEFKNDPMLGGNAKDMLNGTVDPFWVGRAKAQLKRCLLEPQKLTVTETGIELILL